VLESTLANVSKYKNCYSDFPIGNDEPVYYDQKGLLGYLERYADFFDLRPRIRLGIRVLGIEKATGTRKGWLIRMIAPISWSSHKAEQLVCFDKVVIATGAHHTPHVPTIEGEHLFRGRMIHSSTVKNPQDFAGLRVMIVGFSNTAADISNELVKYASKVLVSHRRGIYVLPRIVDGKPADLFANRRIAAITATMAAIAPIRSLSIMNNGLEDISNRSFDLDPSWNFRPAPGRITNRIMLSDTFVPQLAAGSIKSVANMARILSNSTIELVDGSKESVDCIIFCTGYRRRNPPFLSNLDLSTSPTEKDVDASKDDIVPHRLYHNIFPPAYADSFAFLDSWQLGTGICEIADLACMAITQVWKGGFSLPSEAQMNREIDAHHRWVNAVLSNEPAAAAKAVQEGKWRAWLNQVAGTGVNENLGYGLKGWWFWIQQPRFCNLLMGGVDSPHVMRLFEGRRKKWRGARDAIVAVNGDVEERFGKVRKRTKIE
jgi:dimethylaniline monooxygenase (N-oxide forming)